jgi:hypothetical protein
MKHVQKTGIQVPGFPKVIINKLRIDPRRGYGYNPIRIGTCSFCEKSIDDGFYVVIASSTICHYECFLDFIDCCHKNKDSIKKQMMILNL